MSWNKKTKYYSLLTSLFLFQIISIVLSALTDKVRHSYSPFVNLKSIIYWTWFFTWWSFLTSLLTIFWVIYKLINKKVNNYFSQLSDLMILTGHLISGIVFVTGWVVLALSNGKIRFVRPPHGKIANILIDPLPFTAKQTWVLYQTILHIITPLLIFYFFWKFSQVNLLRKKITNSLLFSLSIPTFYYFLVIFRPIIHFSNIYPKTDRETGLFTNQAFSFPSDYPFTFFYRCAGKKSAREDKYFDKYGTSSISRILWTLVIFILCYLFFSLLSFYLIKWKATSEKKLIEPCLI